ncbi:hypothetical protein BDQ12DRAFT_431451 [Crucibulum laeve]|uniref:BRCT domain-containing protein n=1 Tax=Crucibulum laeve TaxID=68775 RepID=A0A5C3M942_9AGAR|nr:hypothetical protein BDQ12DRAFT_431451 [Crucibulum laeve]
MSAGPSSSQAEKLPPLYINGNGTPMQVFVEAGGIINRPRLVRRLKERGAAICHSPKDAQVVLLNPTSDQGRAFLRLWGGNANRVILEYKWEEGCRAKDRLLGADEDWGGYVAVDDGLPISQGDGEEDTNPIPRAREVRETPVEAPSSSLSARRSAPSISGSTSRRMSSDQRPPTSESSRSTPFTSQGSEPPSGSYAGNVVADASTQGGMAQFPFFGMQNMSMPFSQTQHMPTPGSQPQHIPNPATVAQNIADTARGYPPEVLYAMLQNFPMQQMFNYPYAGMQQPPFQNMGPPAVPVLNGNDMTQSPTPSDNSDRKPGGASPILPPSISRKFSESSASSSPTARRSSKGEGKQRSGSPSQTSTSHPFNDHRKSVASSSQSGKIFTSESGEGLSFFVQIDMHNRFNVVNSIKKNGGKISNSHTTADYTVLYSRTPSFKLLCEQAVEAETPIIVTSQFVHDCVKQGSLLDASSYFHEAAIHAKAARDVAKDAAAAKEAKIATPKGGKAGSGLSRKEGKGEKERSRLHKNEKQREYARKRKLEEGGSVRQPKSSKIQKTQKVERVPRSPTPPTETLPRGGGSTHFLYTQDEHAYVLKYLKVLLEREHTASDASLAAALYKKMPHHPVGSWKSYLARTIPNELAEIKKKAGIAYRKIKSQEETLLAEAQVGSQREENMSTSTPARSTGETSVDTSPPSTLDTGLQTKQDELDDIEFLANFFAFEGGDEDGQDDTEVWASLKKMATCKTAPSWEEFWNIRNKEVNARYEHLLATSEMQAVTNNNSNNEDDISLGRTDFQPPPSS